VTGPEPIRKSPREYIIPIAVEGGGYITPRAGSLEPSISETSAEASRLHYRSSGCLSKPRKMRYWPCTLFIADTAKKRLWQLPFFVLKQELLL